jgi:hypothetical protein
VIKIPDLEIICPVCEEEISISAQDLKLASVQRGKTEGKVLVGCPKCARVLEVPDVPEKGIGQWIATITENDDWLGCVPLMDEEQAKIPGGSVGDLAFKRYRAGQNGPLLDRRTYMWTYGVDPKIHMSLNPSMGAEPFDTGVHK